MSKLTNATRTLSKMGFDEADKFVSYIRGNFTKPVSVILEVNSPESFVSLSIANVARNIAPLLINDVIAISFYDKNQCDAIQKLKKSIEPTSIKYFNLDITDDVSSMSSEVLFNNDDLLNITKNPDNIKRLSTFVSRSILYYISNITNGIVLSSIHADDLSAKKYDEIYEMVGDVNLVGKFTKDEIDQLGQMYEIPILEHTKNQYGTYIKNKPYNVDNCCSMKNDLDNSNIHVFSDQHSTAYQMSQSLQNVLHSMRGPFDANQWIYSMAHTFNKFLKDRSISTIIIAVSGGVDSAVSLGIANKTKELFYNELNIIPVAIPIGSTASIQNRAYEQCSQMHINCLTANLTHIHDNLCQKVTSELSLCRNGFSDGCFKSSLRAPVLYYMSILRGDSIVLGTGNKSEDGYLRYFSKSGDGLVCVQLISNLYKAYVTEVGRCLNIIPSILQAVPSADLFDNQTDEGELCFSYDFVELYMRLQEEPISTRTKIINGFSSSVKFEFNKFEQLVNNVHQRNKHKAELAILLY